MKLGKLAITPRFGMVRISAMFADRETATGAGFTEPTFYANDPDWDIRGKSLNLYNMVFAAIQKEQQ